MIRYISDCHFGHKNIISYDNRPFTSVQEMDDGMVSLWNEVVKKDDTVYVLGDFCWSQAYEDWVTLLAKLNGSIFIIKGNHDRSSILKELYKKGHIVGWSQQEIVKDGQDKVILNHSPMPFFINEHHDNWAHLYGHVHISYDWNMMLDLQRRITDLYMRKIRFYNVGCMMPYIKYAPRTLHEIETEFAKTDLLQLEFSKNHAWANTITK